MMCMYLKPQAIEDSRSWTDTDRLNVGISIHHRGRPAAHTDMVEESFRSGQVRLARCRSLIQSALWYFMSVCVVALSVFTFRS